MSFTFNTSSSDSKQPLHTGKWTYEESEYVQELIKQFEAGALNIDENISLRRFLSQALNCSPKRISKKFEGSEYNGKQLFKRKVSEMAPEQVAARRAKLHVLEKKYQESLRVLELVENSRKPTGNVTTSGAAVTSAFLARVADSAETAPDMHRPAPVPQLILSLPAAAGTFVSGFNSGFPASQSDISRAARIAKLKADIAILESAQQSSPTFPTGTAASLQECLMQGRNNVLASSAGAVGTSNDHIRARFLEQMAQREILASLPSSEGSAPWMNPSMLALAHHRQFERRQHQLLSFMDARTTSLLSTESPLMSSGHVAGLGSGFDGQLHCGFSFGKHAHSAAVGNEGKPPMKRSRLA